MRIAFVAPDDWTVWLFYRHLVGALRNAGATITVYSGGGCHVPRLRDLGVEHVRVPYARFVNPRADLQLLHALRRAFSARRFDLVQNFTIKANLYGALAAIGGGITSIINTVEGAGLLYSARPNLRLRAIRAIAEAGLRWVRPGVSRYWFVNPHDRDVFLRRKVATAEQAVVATATGVDTRRFDPATVPRDVIAKWRRELGVSSDKPLVTLVAGRLLQSKGIGEFLEMARALRRARIAAQAVLVGPEEPGNPDAFPRSTLAAAVREGVVRWVAYREDVWTAYAASRVVVVPTYYAEGTPKGVMEGMAAGRPIVASDIPSIRNMVTPGKDGLLVPPGRPAPLAEAVVALLSSPERCAALGEEARCTAVRRFDAVSVARHALGTVYAGLPGWSLGQDAVA